MRNSLPSPLALWHKIKRLINYAIIVTTKSKRYEVKLNNTVYLGHANNHSYISLTYTIVAVYGLFLYCCVTGMLYWFIPVNMSSTNYKCSLQL